MLQNAPSLLTKADMEHPLTITSHGAALMGGTADTSHCAVRADQCFLAWHIYSLFQMDFPVMFDLL